MGDVLSLKGMMKMLVCVCLLLIFSVVEVIIIFVAADDHGCQMDYSTDLP